MTKENMIFLGACTIMSSSPYMAIHPTSHIPIDIGLLNRAIEWSTEVYDRVHGQTGTEEKWEVQVKLFPSSNWQRSLNTGIHGTFTSYEAANEAMEKHRGTIYKDMYYRVNQVF